MSESTLGRLIAWLVTAYQRQRAIERMSGLRDHLLRDIGIDRDEIPDAVDGLISRSSMPVAPPGARRAGFRLRPGTSRSILR